MDINFILILSLILAYLIGSLNFALIISKIFNLSDPKSGGSKNAGATNVLRLSGKKFGIIVLLGDFLKAVIPLMICKYFLDFGVPELVYIGFAIFLGHVFPIYFNLKGGKGVATGLGVILVLSPLVTLCLLIIFVLTLVTTRYVSFSSILAAFFMPILSFLIIYNDLNALSLIVMCALSLLLILMHHSNIKKIFNNTEGKLW
tara:strand:- start:6196 stop:6801 length:606 start_codon:yes stop_codon:yes gene_type:complete